MLVSMVKALYASTREEDAPCWTLEIGSRVFIIEHKISDGTIDFSLRCDL